MRQLLRIKNGVLLKNVPSPVCGPKDILVRNEASTIFGNVEENILNSKKDNIIKKLFTQKKLFNFAMNKLRNDGFLKTYSFGKAMMANWHTLGALSAGKVIKIGKKVSQIKEGDRVACVGWHLANHSEFVSIPQEFTIKIPSGLSSIEATIGIYASKLLQIIDNLKINNSSRIVINQANAGSILLQQLLNYKGIKSLILDRNSLKTFNKSKIDYFFMVHQDSEELITKKVLNSLNGSKCVLISEKNTAPNFLKNKKDFFCKLDKYRFFLDDKKLRFDKSGAEYMLNKGINEFYFKQFLFILKSKRLDLTSFIQKEIKLSEVPKLYFNGIGNTFSTIIKYPGTKLNYKAVQTIRHFNQKKPKRAYGFAILGAGNMARNIHIPLLKKNPKIFIKYILTKSGRSAACMCNHYNVPYSTSSYETILKDPEINTIVILTHHSSHADYAIKAINARKNVFVEKPLAINSEQCSRLEKAYKKKQVIFSAGFNKTFSPLSKLAYNKFKKRKKPLIVTYRLQAEINRDKAWYYDPLVGGGRLIGEYCHLFDFVKWLIDSPVRDMAVFPLKSKDPYILPESNLIANISFKDGSVASIVCSEDGNMKSSKERVEIISGNNIITIDDWKIIEVNGKRKNFGMKKGYEEHWESFIRKLKGESVELAGMKRSIETMKLCFKANDLIK